MICGAIDVIIVSIVHRGDSCVNTIIDLCCFGQVGVVNLKKKNLTRCHSVSFLSISANLLVLFVVINCESHQ